MSASRKVRKLATGGERAHLGGELEDGYYVKPTVFVGHNKMRIFQEEIFGPVLSVTTFKTVEDAIAIGNDTIYGLGAGVWSRNGTVAYRVGREIKAGRVWTNCYHMYPAHAAFGGYKQSGYRPRDAQDDHGALPADQEPAGQLQPERHGLLLTEGRAPRGKFGGCFPRSRAATWRTAHATTRLRHRSSGGLAPPAAPAARAVAAAPVGRLLRRQRTDVPARGGFRIGPRDVLLGVAEDCPFYVGAAQFPYWANCQLTLDVTKDGGDSFSLEAADGVRLIVRSRLFSDAELDKLDAAGPLPRGPQAAAG